jgi:hypothetical protein
LFIIIYDLPPLFSSLIPKSKPSSLFKLQEMMEDIVIRYEERSQVQRRDLRASSLRGLPLKGYGGVGAKKNTPIPHPQFYFGAGAVQQLIRRYQAEPNP